ncbi:TonB-dependent receptor domain-containing protein [Chelatococcus reniformis]|uniref:TonB-dependent receptor n=1 Tax=Chelatococcus reniformis TaxID=1494448 RepID=A0A916XGL0_9HYPH|nr:TonB-dependent receptor [Chelatococcus reniformis]GGC72012.1 TonB-dependent receptor [Chelatococcus reniformis]
MGIGVLALAFGAADARAEETKPRRTAAPVAASEPAPPPSAPGTIELDTISVTATRQPTQILEVPGTVTVTTRQQLDEHIVRDNQELVRYQPGITVDRQTSGTDPFGNLGGFTIRGVGGNRVQMQVDGTRIQERITDGNRNFTDFPGLKAVEIVRGPGSVLWGADALGGIVAFRTLDPSDLLLGSGKPIAGRIETSFDTFDNSFSKTAMAAAQFTPELAGIVLVNQKSFNEGNLGRAKAYGGLWGCPRVADAIRCDTLNPLDGNVWNMLTKLVYTPSADHELKLTGELYSSDSDIVQLYDFGRQRNGSYNAEYPRNQVQTRKRLSFAHNWNVGASFLDNVRWQVSYSPQQRKLNSDRWQSNTTRQNVHTNDILDYTEEFLQADVQLSSHFDLAGARHNLTYGFQGDTTDTDYFRQSTVDNLTRRTTTVTRAGGSNFANSTTTRADLYLQDEIRMFDDRLIVTPGVRWANYNIDPRPDADYVVVPGRTPRELKSSRVIPQIGAIYKLTDVYSLYARYAEGFKMPTAQQLYSSLPSLTMTIIPNPNLRPETVRSYEGGVRGNFGNAWFSVGAFYADYTNFIQNFYEIQPNVYTYRNLTAVKIWGIEAFGEYVINENWAVNAALSYQYGKQQYEAGERYVPYDGATPLNGVIGVKWMKPEWGLTVEVLGTAAQGVSRASSPTLFKPASYATLDSFVNWKINDTFTVRAGVLNIFDARYFKGPLPYQFDVAPSEAVRISNPLELQTAPGRTFKVSAVANF